MIQVSKDDSWLVQQAANNPGSIALVSGSVQLSYKELYEQSLSISRQLDKYGIGQNEHVALILNNSLEYALVIYAAWLKGCTPVVINPGLSGRNIIETSILFVCYF